MKIIAVFLIAAGLGFFGGYIYLGKQKDSQLKAGLAETTAKAEQMNAVAAELKQENAQLKALLPSSAVAPEETVARLATLNPVPPERRTRVIRQIVHQLECLVDAGTNSILPIRHFLASGVDVDYVFEEGPSLAPSFWNWHPGLELRSGLVLPPTLRISLADVFRYIGGEDAEVSLAWMLSTTTHPMEVPYLAQALEKIAPGRYTELSGQAAQRLLLASPTNANSGKMDAVGVGYIYNWLSSRGDTSAVAAASQNLVSPAGRFDAEAAHYLLTTKKDEALPALAKAYSSADTETKNKIANMAFDYVGDGASADAIFKDWILGQDQETAPGAINARPRSLALLLLSGGIHGPFRAPVPTDPKVISGRLRLLNELMPTLDTPRLKEAADQSIRALKALPGAL